jgi:phosphoglycolate phosphatase-like HAD superfamily hydrolase
VTGLDPAAAAGAEPLVVSLDSELFELRPARAAALSDALGAYVAIAGPRPETAALARALPADVGDDAAVVELGATALCAVAAGSSYPPGPGAPVAPAAAVDRPALARLFAEAWLGSELYQAATDALPRPGLAGHIHAATPLATGRDRLRAARNTGRPVALVTALTVPEALFLLASHDLSGFADQIVATDPGARPEPPPARVAAALARLARARQG